MSKDTGGYAFPFVGHTEGAYGQDQGMTLRDYFAAKAMHMAYLHWPEGHPNGFEALAKFAYNYADAMLKARQS